RKGAVGLPSVQDAAAVNAEKLALAQPVMAGKAVNHLIVDGSTDGIGKALETLERGNAAGLANETLGHLIQVHRRDARTDLGSQSLEHAVEQRARPAHFLDL